MIVKTDQRHTIFDSENYIKDIVPFNLLEIIKVNPILLESNEEDFVIGASDLKKPIWIWTSDLISEDNLKELSNYFYHKFKSDPLVRFVAKPEIASELSKKFIEELEAVESRIHLKSYENPNPVKVIKDNVKIINPRREDLEEIAVCLYNFEKDCFNREIPREQLLQNAKAKIENQNFYVIEQNGKIVTTAQISRETETHCAISQVYTLPEFRGKGLASAIVSFICDKIIENGKTPLLYTDESNAYSNKAYKKLGFLEKGNIEEVTLKWNKL